MEVNADDLFGEGAAASLPRRSAAWRRVADSVGQASGISRTAEQCQKKYADVRRLVKKKLSERAQAQTGGGSPPQEPTLTPTEELVAARIPSQSVVGFGGPQVGGVPGNPIQIPLV